MGMHTGTHIDMPSHLTEDARGADCFPADPFIGEGALLDARGEKTIALKPEYLQMDLTGKIVLLLTGFSEKYQSPEYFHNYPQLDMELARFLAGKKIKMLGMDTPAPDYAPFEVHKLLLSNGVFILENLTGLHRLAGAGAFEVIAVPLPIAAEASPVRAVIRLTNAFRCR